ncbi:methyl-accepting chemotaxis protein [Herbaspirillum huttiense]|uniref:methyl-accepting chemotaxis protein n=1 Tax=Herbaspirillum huttiense TaxID=863372 RepID=UPI0039AEE40A
MRSIRIDERKQDLTNLAEVGLNQIRQFDEQVKAGKLSLVEAQERARSAIRYMRYGKDGYITITNTDGVTVMHPIKAELDGKNMMGFKDPSGYPLYRDIIAAAKSGDGTGFVSYLWARPGEERALPKLTRVATYQPWGWVLTVGVYVDDINRAFRDSLFYSGGVLIIICSFLVLLVTLLNRRLRWTIGGDPEKVAAIALRIAGSDFTVPIKAAEQDQSSIVFAMKSMQKHLSSAVNEVRRSAESIASASSQIAAGNNDLAMRTSEQAATLGQTVANMEQLTSLVQRNADQTAMADALVKKTSTIAEQGGKVVSEVVKTMSGITDSSRKVSEIISVIDAIAFQTNILALNAAVEAARAGEEGRGFAVVATEVRTLAQRSSQAAKEIKGLIDDSLGRVDEGAQLVAQSGTTMNEIIDAIREVSALMQRINETSGDQNRAISDTFQAVSGMDDVTQQNAALVEESAAAAGALDTQARHLERLVSVFKTSRDDVLMDGRGTGSIAVRR